MEERVEEDFAPLEKFSGSISGMSRQQAVSFFRKILNEHRVECLIVLNKLQDEIHMRHSVKEHKRLERVVGSSDFFWLVEGSGNDVTSVRFNFRRVLAMMVQQQMVGKSPIKFNPMSIKNKEQMVIGSWFQFDIFGEHDHLKAKKLPKISGCKPINWAELSMIQLNLFQGKSYES